MSERWRGSTEYLRESRPQLLTGGGEDGTVFLTHMGEPFDRRQLTALVRGHLIESKVGKMGGLDYFPGARCFATPVPGSASSDCVGCWLPNPRRPACLRRRLRLPVSDLSAWGLLRRRSLRDPNKKSKLNENTRCGSHPKGVVNVTLSVHVLRLVTSRYVRS